MLEALKALSVGNIKKAKMNIEIYLKSPVGIGEHPDILGAIQDQVDVIAKEEERIEIIKKYEKYISCWKSEDDDGLYDALNKGVKSATGEFIGFLHSDDFFSSSEVIAYIANELMSNEYDFVHSNLIIVALLCI